jgi:hypothetical protein
MKLLLHIGTEKTGTTTLQSWFGANRDLLQTQGIYYPKTLGIWNHRNLAIFARDADKPDDGFHQEKILTIEDHQIFSSNLIVDFEREYLKNSNIHSWVISNEHLHSRLTSVTMVSRVKQFLAEKFDDIEVIVHLRPQIDVAMSLASTAARLGMKVGLNDFLDKDSSNLYYDYELLVKRWETVFGANCLTIVPFLKKPCMTSFLIDKLGIEKDNLPAIYRTNESIDWRTIALVNAISIPHFYTKNSLNRYNRNIFINDLPYKERLSVGLDIAKQFQSVFEDSNNKLINRRNDLNSDDLTPEWGKYSIPANIHHLDNRPVFTEQLSYLVMRFNWEIKLEKCNTKLAECERDLLLGKSKNALMCLEQAKTIIQEVPYDKSIDLQLKQISEKIGKMEKKLSIKN